MTVDCTQEGNGGAKAPEEEVHTAMTQGSGECGHLVLDDEPLAL